MKNPTTINVPKKYQKMIDEIYKDSEGYWAYSKDGYYFKGMGAHTAHEDTQKDLLSMIRTLDKCSCDECTSNLIKKEIGYKPRVVIQTLDSFKK